MSIREALLLLVVALLTYSNKGSMATSPSNCRPQWSVTVDQSSVGAIPHIGPESVRDCLKHCAETSGCIAVDVQINAFPPGCFPHLNDSYLTPSNTYYLPGTNQYRLTNRCSTLPAERCTEAEWEKYYGHTAVGATEHVGPRTIRQCLDFCEQIVECVGVDIDVNVVPLRCWPHFSRNNIRTDNVYPQQNTVHYRLMSRCNHSTNATAASKCYNPEWKVYDNQHSPNATRYDEAHSVQECLDYCGSRADCVAADVDLTEKLAICWLHFSNDSLHAVYSQQGFNQYRLLERCVSNSPDKNCRQLAWITRRDKSALGGTRYVGPRTIQQCLDYCNATASCVAVDIDVNVVPLRCWTHFNADDLRENNVYRQPGTNLYKLVSRCPNTREESTCYSPEWEVIENHNSAGATQYEAVYSVQECLDYCGSQDSCVAVDVDLTKQPPTCWPHFSAEHLLQHNSYTQQGTNQYRFKLRCADPITAPPTEPTMTSRPRPLGADCRQSAWKIRRGEAAVGAALYVGPRTIQQCLDYCNDTASCVGVDIDVNVVPLRCWTHFDAADLHDNNVYDQPGTDLYVLVGRCPNAREVSSYNPEWEMYKDQNSVGATPYDAALSVQECLDHCGSQDSCVAADVDLSKKPPSCWLHFSKDYLLKHNVYSQPGTNQYRLKDRRVAGPITVTRAPEVPVTGKACTESTWKKYENQSSAGASLYASAKTVQECQKYCVDNPSCVGVDVNVLHDPPTCWPHYSIEKWQKDNIANHHGIIQYRLVQRCDHADSPNDDEMVIIALAVGLGVPLLIVTVCLIVSICCAVAGRCRDPSTRPVEAFNKFMPFPRTIGRRGGDTLKSSTTDDSGQDLASETSTVTPRSADYEAV